MHEGIAIAEIYPRCFCQPRQPLRRLVEFSITSDHHATTTNTPPMVQTMIMAQSARVQISTSLLGEVFSTSLAGRRGHFAQGPQASVGHGDPCPF
jgi:hypothetical protein